MTAPLRAYAMLFASMSLVGTYVALSRPLVASLPVFALAWMRFAIAAVALLPWSGPEPGAPPLAGRARLLLFLQSFFGNFLFSICMLKGLSQTSATAAGVVMSSLPAAVAVGSAVGLREPLGRRALIAIAFAVAGMASLNLSRAPGPGAPGRELAGLMGAGTLWLLGAVACEALYVILGKRLAAHRSPLRVSAWINLWGLALMTPLGFGSFLQLDFPAIHPATWLLLVFYALSASLIAVALWMAGLRHVPAHRAGVFTAALPVAATGVGVLVLGEPFGLAQAAALACALAGIALATVPEAK